VNAAGRQIEDIAEPCRIHNDTELVPGQFPAQNDFDVPQTQNISFVAAEQPRGIQQSR
jgi:hypothetical protein